MDELKQLFKHLFSVALAALVAVLVWLLPLLLFGDYSSEEYDPYPPAQGWALYCGPSVAILMGVLTLVTVERWSSLKTFAEGYHRRRALALCVFLCVFAPILVWFLPAILFAPSRDAHSWGVCIGPFAVFFAWFLVGILVHVASLRIGSQQGRTEAQVAPEALARTPPNVGVLADSDRIGPDMKGKNLRNADLVGADLENANLKQADLMGANLAGANLKNANLTRANLVNSNLGRADLTGALLYRTDLEGASLIAANMKNVSLQSQYWQPATSFGCVLWPLLWLLRWWERGDPLLAASHEWTGADFRRADLTGATLTGSYLKKAVLFDAVLQYAVLKDANLRWARLDGADLSGANLRGADLKGAVLNGAKYSAQTVWPDGFNPEMAGAMPIDQIG